MNCLLSNEEFDKSLVAKEAINLSPLSLKHCTSKTPAFVLYNCFTSEECGKLIEMAEGSNNGNNGFSEVSVNIDGMEVQNDGVRSGARNIIDSHELVDCLWNRIKSFIPSKLKGARVIGLNERLRFLRYHPGQKFAPHYDGTYTRAENPMEVSLMTLQIYLNEDFEGGETTFFGDEDEGAEQETSKRSVSFIPRSGSILAFEQDLMHEGSILKSGVKYTIRTDVMYSYT